MRIDNVLIPGRYSAIETFGGDGRVYTHTDQVSKSRHFQISKTDRDESPKPVGWLYPKPYHITLSRYIDDPGGMVDAVKLVNRWPYGIVEDRVRYRGNIGHGVGASVVSAPPGSSNERRKAEIDALTKLKNQRINLGIAFAEHRKTAQFVGGAFSAIANSVQLAMRKDWKNSYQVLRRAYANRTGRGIKNPRKSPRGLPNDWLAWQYAAKPLINDVNGAISALQHRNDVSDWIQTVKGVSVNKWKDTSDLQVGTALHTRREAEYFRGYFVRLDYHPGIDFLSTLSSLGVTNPLSALWEIVPFSFVIDWAIPIGEWFNTLDATLGWDFLSGSITERRETNAVWSPSSIGRVDNYGYIKESAKHTTASRHFVLDRSVYLSSPIPMLPRFKQPLSSSTVASGLSLLVGVLSRADTRMFR